MTPIEQQMQELKTQYSGAFSQPLLTGGHLIEIPYYKMPPGWNVDSATILFLAPPGYPAAQPDCFWVEPKPVRLQNGATPQNTNDTNLIPGVPTQRGTWFSWHLQYWDPNRDSLMRFVNAIKQRLSPAR
jgi:Prokaryotic E2 family E